MAPQAEEMNVHIEVTGESVLYHGVRPILDEMIYNICENGIKYNNRGGSISIWVGSCLLYTSRKAGWRKSGPETGNTGWQTSWTGSEAKQSTEDRRRSRYDCICIRHDGSACGRRMDAEKQKKRTGIEKETEVSRR